MHSEKQRIDESYRGKLLEGKRMLTLARKTAIAVVGAISCVTLGGPGAHAAEPAQSPHPAGEDVTPRECLRYDDARYLDYTLASANVSGSPSDAYLYCRYPGRGLFHVAARHPVPSNETANDNFVRCVMNIGEYGDTTGQDDQGRYGQKMNRADGGTATFIYEVNDANEYEIASVFTSDGARGNNWEACANLPA